MLFVENVRCTIRILGLIRCGVIVHSHIRVFKHKQCEFWKCLKSLCCLGSLSFAICPIIVKLNLLYNGAASSRPTFQNVMAREENGRRHQLTSRSLASRCLQPPLCYDNTWLNNTSRTAKKDWSSHTTSHYATTVACYPCLDTTY